MTISMVVVDVDRKRGSVTCVAVADGKVIRKKNESRRDELHRLIAEQAVDRAGEPSGSRGDRVKGIMRSDSAEMDAHLSEGAELSARREAFLAHYPFRTHLERRIYELHTAGLAASEIAKRMHRAKLAIQRVIWRVERSIYADAVVHTFNDLRVWQYWLHGWAPCNIAQRCGVSGDCVARVVREAIREWRRSAPSSLLMAFLDCPGEFVGKLGDLTPAAALEAGQRDPEIAEMLQRLGLVAS